MVKAAPITVNRNPGSRGTVASTERERERVRERGAG